MKNRKKIDRMTEAYSDYVSTCGKLYICIHSSSILVCAFFVVVAENDRNNDDDNKKLL